MIVVPILFIVSGIFMLFSFQYFSKASSIKANITIDILKLNGKISDRWKALAQGGEEKGVRMLENVVSQLSGLYPKYIRLDHIYDFYDVVTTDSSGNLLFNWDKLDAAVCDIYHAGAKPFLSLGYMPPSVSSDGSLISVPKKWEDWSTIVQKTIEHYSGTGTRLCGQITGYWLNDIYYEVWNEPDLESFGKWSIWGGTKDYKTLYRYSVEGAAKAENVHHFFIGGPVTTALYQSWIQSFLDYTMQNNLRVDFISWHHYSKNPDDYIDDMTKVNSWLSDSKYDRYRSIPRIISEWGYDSEPNPIADTDVGAAHTVTAIRNFMDQDFDYAFLFEIKDGPSPRWGILGYNGERKPRYQALKLLNQLSGNKIEVQGEGTFVRAIASREQNKTVIVLVNYDRQNRNTELVPVTITNLLPGSYSLTTTRLNGDVSKENNLTISGDFQRNIIMQPNSVVSLELNLESQ